MHERVGFEGLGAEQIHAVGGACAGYNDQTRDLVWCSHLCSFGGKKVRGRLGGLDGDVVEEDLRLLAEGALDLTQPLFQSFSSTTERLINGFR